MTEVVIEVQRLDGGTLRIRHAAEMAQVFFRLDPSANGPKAFDTLATKTNSGGIEVSDVSIINATMAARTPLYRWQDLIAQNRPAWLAALDKRWSLFDLTDEAWTDLEVERKIADALGEMIGPGRRLAVVTKVLHMKRPDLIPVCDRLVLDQVGAPPGVDQNPIRSAAVIGHMRHEGQRNLPALREIQGRLEGDGYHRSLVRIFEVLIWQSHPDVWYQKLAPIIAEWLGETQVEFGGAGQ